MLELSNSKIFKLDVDTELVGGYDCDLAKQLITIETAAGATIKFIPEVINPFGDAVGVDSIGSLFSGILFSQACGMLDMETLGEFVETRIINDLHAQGRVEVVNVNGVKFLGAINLDESDVYYFIKKHNKELFERTFNKIYDKSVEIIPALAKELGLESLNAKGKVLLLGEDEVSIVDYGVLFNGIAAAGKFDEWIEK